MEEEHKGLRLTLIIFTLMVLAVVLFAAIYF
jgi:hypothetical protein